MSALPGTRGRRRVLLMRHGEVNYFTEAGERVGEPDKVRLTLRGQRQAEAMADVLSGLPIDRAMCTSLPRTRQTAEAALAGHRLTLEENPDLREIRTGRPDLLDRERLWRDYVRGFERGLEPDATFSNGEALAPFYARVTTAFERVLLEPGWSMLLLVAHGGVNRALLAWATGGIAVMGAYEQDMCCLNVIDADVIDGAIERRIVRAVNITPDNPAKRDSYLTSLEAMWQRKTGSPP